MMGDYKTVSLEPAESFSITMGFRWFSPRFNLGYDKVLQQLWLGTNGTERWVDVPTVAETYK